VADRYDLVVVGMGSAGIVAAELAVTLGLRVAAVEHGRVGGDCLWTGCVPSKALIASARVAHHVRVAGRFGIGAVEPAVDTASVWRRIRAVQEEIAATDDAPARFTGLGVDLVAGEARVTGPHTVAAGDRTLDTRHILIATGSRPAIPPVAGLREAGFLTSETVFALERAPRSVVVVGGGPAGTEMAQALCRLGVPVTLLERGPRLLPRDEPELVAILSRLLSAEGVEIVCGVDIRRVTVEDGHRVVHGDVAGGPRRWEAADLLVAVGRRPNVEGLGLEEAGVEVGPGGVVVDDGMRTSVRSIHAAGDVIGHELFTHAAAHHAVLAVRDMFFPGRARARAPIPWCTFTDPELAHVGMTAAQARAAHGDGAVEVRRRPLAHSDRGRSDGATDGAIAIVTARGRVAGAHILAPAAGELIAVPTLAIARRLRLTDIAGVVTPYPTYSTDITLVAAEAAYASARRLRRLLRLTRRWRHRRPAR
jgi:pyruvate/2-oxoglutarate dehydrogenase complex dihydrolipoamide dehydrogenase (E3) component